MKLLKTPKSERWMSLNHFMLWICELTQRENDFSSAQSLVPILGEVVHGLPGNPPEPHRKNEEVQELARAQETGLQQRVAHVVPASQSAPNALFRPRPNVYFSGSDWSLKMIVFRAPDKIKMTEWKISLGV